MDEIRQAVRDYLDARLDHTVSDTTVIEYADRLAQLVVTEVIR